MAVADTGVTQVESFGSETESLEFEDWGSHASGNEEVPIQVDDTPLEVQEVRNITPAVRVALTELDGVNLSEEFSKPLMKNVPHCSRRPYRNAMRLAMNEANHSNAVRSKRGWRLFLLLPRLLLHRPPRGGPPPFGAPHPSGAYFFWVWASTLRDPPSIVPKIQHPKLAKVEIGRNRNWPKSKKKSWP